MLRRRRRLKTRSPPKSEQRKPSGEGAVAPALRRRAMRWVMGLRLQPTDERTLKAVPRRFASLSTEPRSVYAHGSHLGRCGGGSP